MDINGILTELRAERERIEEAILTLERLVRTEGKRRGRPPKWMTALQAAGESTEDGSNESASGEKRRRRFSPEARKRMAEAQRKRWAAAREKQEGA